MNHQHVLSGSIIYPEDHLPFFANLAAGLQHVVAMFGATVLGPLLMGFDPNVAIFFSGIATLIFYVLVRGRIPSFLGSSFSFIAAVIAATAYSGIGPNPNMGVALGGIIAAGAVYVGISLLVLRLGHKWIEHIMPPVLTGTIVAIIGLNLAPVAVHQINANGADMLFGLLTLLLVVLSALYLPSSLARLPILIGGGVAYFIYYCCGNLAHIAKPIDFSPMAHAAWFGLPHFSAPVFSMPAITMIAPVAIILVAENLGHVRAIGAMTGRNLDPWLGYAFLGDGLATILSGACGGTGVTTYAENMGVMAMTRNFSSRTFVVAALFAILFGLSPKFGSLIHTIPMPVIGGLSFIVFGLITATAGRIWVENNVDFTHSRNLMVVGIAVIISAGDLTLRFGSFALGGIAVATFGALILYHLLSFRRMKTPSW